MAAHSRRFVRAGLSAIEIGAWFHVPAHARTLGA